MDGLVRFLKDQSFGASSIILINQGALKIQIMTNHHLLARWAYTKTGSCGPGFVIGSQDLQREPCFLRNRSDNRDTVRH